MLQPTNNELAQTRTALANARTKLAERRTAFAEDRTALALIRTGNSFIGFAILWLKLGGDLLKGKDLDIKIFSILCQKLLTLVTLIIYFQMEQWV